MTQRSTIRQTAEGMIRNYGANAKLQALRIASKYAADADPVPQELWMAVHKEIEVIQIQGPQSSRDRHYITGVRRYHQERQALSSVVIANLNGERVHRMAISNEHNHGGQQGSTKHGNLDHEETKAGSGSIEIPKDSSNAKKPGGEDFSEKKQQERGGDPDNASETTGGSESGGEDKGAKV